MKLVYTDDAIDDLKRLREFIAVHNPSAAGRIAQNWLAKSNYYQTSQELGYPLKWQQYPVQSVTWFLGNTLSVIQCMPVPLSFFGYGMSWKVIDNNFSTASRLQSCRKAL